MEITFDKTKLKRVLITEVRPNTWNPKKRDTDDFRKIVQSIKQNGLRRPIVVRQNNGYEIIDGEQRYFACLELNYTEVVIYDEGTMSDMDAKALTIWYQQQVPFDRILEADLVLEIADLSLPYTDLEIQEMKDISEFDWESVQPDDLEDVEFRTFSVKLHRDQYQVVMAAINKLQKLEEVSTERALELICADYLAK